MVQGMSYKFRCRFWSRFVQICMVDALCYSPINSDSRGLYLLLLQKHSEIVVSIFVSKNKLVMAQAMSYNLKYRFCPFPTTVQIAISLKLVTSDTIQRFQLEKRSDCRLELPEMFLRSKIVPKGKEIDSLPFFYVSDDQSTHFC